MQGLTTATMCPFINTVILPTPTQNSAEVSNVLKYFNRKGDQGKSKREPFSLFLYSSNQDKL